MNSFPNTQRAQSELLEMIPVILKHLEAGETIEIRLSRRGLLKAACYKFERLQVRSEEMEGGAVNG